MCVKFEPAVRYPNWQLAAVAYSLATQVATCFVNGVCSRFFAYVYTIGVGRASATVPGRLDDRIRLTRYDGHHASLAAMMES